MRNENTEEHETPHEPADEFKSCRARHASGRPEYPGRAWVVCGGLLDREIFGDCTMKTILLVVVIAAIVLLAFNFGGWGGYEKAGY